MPKTPKQALQQTRHASGPPGLGNGVERSLAKLASLPGVPKDEPSAEYKCAACAARLDRGGKYGLLAQSAP